MAKILTQRSVDAAKPRAKRYGVRDGLIPGLRLIVHPSGQKTFALFARVNGRLVNTKIGSAAVLNLAAARAKGREVLAGIVDGEDPREAKRAAVKARRTPSRSLPGGSSSATPRSRTRPGGMSSSGSRARCCRAGGGGRSPPSRKPMWSRCSTPSWTGARPGLPISRWPRCARCSTGACERGMLASVPLRSRQGAGAGQQARSRAHRRRAGADLAGGRRARLSVRPVLPAPGVIRSAA